jgi:hypothetical protein
MVTGSRFHSDDQGWIAIQLKDQFFKSFPVHRGRKREDLLSFVPYAARIKLFFRHIDPYEELHTPTSSRVAEKQALPPANPPSSQGLF